MAMLLYSVYYRSFILVIMENKINLLIEKYKTENKNILKRRPDLEMNGDFSPEGIKFYLNEVFIEELREVLYGRS